MSDPIVDPIVEIDGLSRHFGEKAALDNVSVSIASGQVFGVVGENGAGKTTLIKHLLGLYGAQSGMVRVFGEDPVAAPQSVLSRIGYLSEEPDLPGWMCVDELLRYSRAFYPTWDDDYARELLDLFGISGRTRVSELSKGKRAQVGLCVAQAHRPELLLLDEPSSGLDPIVRRDILSAIIRTVVDEGRTVVFSSHLLEEVERVSDHLLMLSHGRVLISDTMDNVLTRHHRIAIRPSRPMVMAGEIPGVFASRMQGPEMHLDCYGERALIEADLAERGAEILSHRCLSLNDVFVARSRQGDATARVIG